MTTADLGAAGARRAWGWVDALRHGGVTPWVDWAGEADPGAGPLPGVQHLELVRRLNRAAGGPVPPGLVDRVLAAGLPGRGRTDLVLPGVGGPTRFGPPPVTPEDLDDEELVRLASGLIAEDLAGLDEAVPPGPAARRRRPWSPSYRLAGDPWLLAPLRADLARRGRTEQARPGHLYLVGADLAAMLAHAWIARAVAESGAGWEVWLGRFAGTDRVPHRADLLTPAREWAARIGTERVTVVLDPDELPRVLRLRRRPARPPGVSGAAVDLARRLGVTLAILVGPDRRTTLLRDVLLPALADGRGDGEAGLAVPATAHGWLLRHARRMRDGLHADGYRVLGDLDRLVPSDPAAGSDPPVGEVLDLALRLLLDPVAPPGAAKGEE